VVEQTKLLQDREAELLTCQEIIRSREQRLSESRELLDSRNADILALGSRVTELTAQLAELNRAKDQEARLFHEELARRAELFRAQESTIANLRDRFAEQIDVLEAQLGETKNLAAARDAQIDSFKAKVSALIQEKAELISDRESAQRATQEPREQAGLLRTMESSLGEMEAQMGEQIRLLALQLEEKQNLLQNTRADLGNLRMQLCVLNQRVDEAEAAKIHAEAMLHKERSRASKSFTATHSPDYRLAGKPAAAPEPALPAHHPPLGDEAAAEHEVHPMAKKEVVYRAPGMEAVTVRLDLEFRRGNGEVLAMDVYLPPGAERAPAVVIVAGYPDAGLEKFVGCRFKEMGSSASWGT